MTYPLLTAFGLALATGADATIPIFLFALLARLGVVPLAAPWDGLLTSPIALIAFGVIAVLDFISSRSDDPTIADLGHRVRQFITIGAGGVLAMTQTRTGLIDSASYAVVGAGVAATMSHSRAGFRRADGRVTPRVRMWAQHLGDAFAVVATLTALRHPRLLAGFLVWAALVFVVLAVLVVISTRKRLKDVLPALNAMYDALRGRASRPARRAATITRMPVIPPPPPHATSAPSTPPAWAVAPPSGFRPAAGHSANAPISPPVGSQPRMAASPASAAAPSPWSASHTSSGPRLPSGGPPRPGAPVSAPLRPLPRGTLSSVQPPPTAAPWPQPQRDRHAR